MILENSNKINYKKIAISTLVKILFMMLIIFIFNTYPLFKALFSGDSPSLNDWLAKSFTWANLFYFIAFTGYFFYKDLNYQKELLKKQAELN